ncbi:hypothetical protein ID144_04450 [Pseudomonas sp. JM0905a]|uniref:Yip1 domain-containing protein n=1 Tax=Metapseudomonas resinovorans TaxID=53412 RepID=A0ABT4Y8N9_METRE|nr:MULTISPECIES: hypothetical protein [Pseudomonas]MBD2836288.1 hypothetical protein [Pseudomonas sp. JM0905a]MDA8485236.1 hypothetical protein [Pseudomonas resinovorans]
MRSLQSLEAFFRKVATWPVSFPRTLWRVLRNPIAVSLYTRQQLAQQPDLRFSGMLSPPLMLILSIVLTHLLVFAREDRPSPSLFGEWLALLVLSFSYGLYALMPALAMLRVRRVRMNPTTLREPFYIQCYLASPLSIMLIAANLLAGIQVVLAMVLTILACIWYVFSQIALLRRLLDLPLLPATFIAISRFIVATLIILALMDLLRSTFLMPMG